VPVIGLLGIILDAKHAGLIPAARPVIDHLLRTTDCHISADLIERVLARVGE
jgi:predicted nucleic acid-binding protein